MDKKTVEITIKDKEDSPFLSLEMSDMTRRIVNMCFIEGGTELVKDDFLGCELTGVRIPMNDFKKVLGLDESEDGKEIIDREESEVLQAHILYNSLNRYGWLKFFDCSKKTATDITFYFSSAFLAYMNNCDKNHYQSIDQKKLSLIGKNEEKEKTLLTISEERVFTLPQENVLDIPRL